MQNMKRVINKKLIAFLPFALILTSLKYEKVFGKDARNPISFFCDAKALSTNVKWLNNGHIEVIIFWEDQNWSIRDGTTLKKKCTDVSAAFQRAYQEGKLKKIISEQGNGRNIICASRNGKQCDVTLYSLLPSDGKATNIAHQLFKRIFVGNVNPLRHSEFSFDIDRFLFGDKITRKGQNLCPIKRTTSSSQTTLGSSPIAGTTDIYNIAKRLTVRVDAMESQGSGVIVARQGNVYCVLTAKHNIQTSLQLNRSIKITTPDGEQHTVQNPRVAPNNIDLAVLEFVSNKKPSYEIAIISDSDKPALAPNETIYIAGFFASNLRDEITEAFVSEARFDAYSAKSFNITYTPNNSEAAATFGMSGGPIFNAQGRLVGIHGAGEAVGARTVIFGGISTTVGILSTVASSLGLNLETASLPHTGIRPKHTPSPPIAGPSPILSSPTIPSPRDLDPTTILVTTSKCPNCDLTGRNFSSVRLQGSDLSRAVLQGTNFRWSNLSEANLSDADLQRADLGSAELRNANLRGANLQNANLSSADLRGADLRGANLQNANLRWAKLNNSDLRGANFQRADLERAELINAKKDGAIFKDAKLSGAEW